jgi:hypothetical protein
MMNNRKKELNEFFAAYEQRFNDGLSGKVDVQGTIDAFAECFVEASPVGIICGQNGNDFRKAIPQGYDFYKSIGTQSMTIAETDITLINDLHAVTKVHWLSHYLRKQDLNPVSIEFDVHYFTQQQNGGPRIFAYITGDEQKALREHGLIPEEAAAHH